jgi:hypothetical protein
MRATKRKRRKGVWRSLSRLFFTALGASCMAAGLVACGSSLRPAAAPSGGEITSVSSSPSKGQNLACETCGGGPVRSSTSTIAAGGTPAGTISSPLRISVSVSSSTGSAVVTDQSSVSISSTGTGPLIISNVTFAATRMQSWSATGACYAGKTAQVAPGTNCTETITYAYVVDQTTTMSPSLVVTFVANGAPLSTTVTGSASPV